MNGVCNEADNWARVDCFWIYGLGVIEWLIGPLANIED